MWTAGNLRYNGIKVKVRVGVAFKGLVRGSDCNPMFIIGGFSLIMWLSLVDAV